MSESDQLFQLANKSVDEMLREIRSTSPEPVGESADDSVHDDSLDAGLGIRTSTAPLKIDGKPEGTQNKPAAHNRDDIESLQVPERSPRRRKPSGPRSPPKSPTKSPRKRVMISAEPIEVVEYEKEEPSEPSELQSEEDVSILEADRVDVRWNSVKPAVITSADQKTVKQIPQTHKPLPKIAASSSVQSMPNMVTNPLEDDENGSDDSELTIAPSPRTQELSSYKKAPASTGTGAGSNSTVNITECPNLAYDHDRYVEDTKRGEVIETADVAENKKYHEELKKSIVPSKRAPESTPVEQAIEDLGGLYDEDIRNNDDGTLKIVRKGSVKSTMSISSGERQLATDIVDKPLPSLGLKEGIQGFTDDDVKEILATTPAEVTQPVEVMTSTTTVEQTTISPGKRGSKSPSHSHSRSSSLTNMMGRFLRSISSKSLDKEAQPQPRTGPSATSGSRNFSGQSVATTMTTESDFVSASEGEFDDDDDDDDNDDLNDFDDDNDNASLASNATTKICREFMPPNIMEGDSTFDGGELRPQLTARDEENTATTIEREPISPVNAALPVLPVSTPTLSPNDDTTSHSRVVATKASPLATNKLRNPLNEDAVSVPILPVSSSTPAGSRNVSASSGTSTGSFGSTNFILNVPEFDEKELSEADPFTDDSYELDPDFSIPRSFQNRVSKPKRLAGGNGETSGMDETLNIWSKQSSFRTSSNHSDDFESIAPRKVSHYVVNSVSPKFVKVISSTSSRNATPASIKTPVSAAPQKERRPSTLHTTPAQIVEANEVRELTEEAAQIDEQLIKADAKVKETEDILENDIDLSALVDFNDDSFLNDIDEWEKDDAPKGVATTNTKRHTCDPSVSKDVTELWRSGTLSNKNRIVSNTEREIQPIHMSADQVEQFMIHKQMTSDAFAVKTANGKAELGSYIPTQPEQKGITCADSPLFAAPGIPTDSASALDLAIPTGSPESEQTSFADAFEEPLQPPMKPQQASRQTSQQASQQTSQQIPQKRLPTDTTTNSSSMASAMDEPRRESMRHKSQDISAMPMVMPQTPKPETKNRYGSLVPDARKAISPQKAQAVDLQRGNTQGTLLEDPAVEFAKRAEAAHATEKAKAAPKLVDGEQGRMFLRLNQLRDLSLPGVFQRDAKFQCVLDNGIHVITTDYFKVGPENVIPIQKEYEFIVPESLDIIMTLKLKYQKAEDELIEIKERKKVKSKNVFARAFGVKNIVTTTRYINKPAKHDPLGELVATDGSFAKFKISFDRFRNQITCRPYNVALNGYDEWQLKGGRPKSFHVCTMDTQMLFVPRRSEYEVLPLSIKNAVSEVQEVATAQGATHEGYMFQEGGDLSVWTRRFFKLQGFDLMAYNESTKKLKAKINLKRVVEIQYPGRDAVAAARAGDGDGFVQPRIPAHKERVISETLILNEGFKLIFANDETIDFGCDSRQERDGWIDVLEDTINKNNFRRQPWVKQMSRTMGLNC